MSSFKILTPYIVNFMSSDTDNFTNDNGLGEGRNLGYGQISDRVYCSDAETSAYLQINHSTATPVDFLYLGNILPSCRLTYPDDLTITVQGSTSDTFGTSEDLTFNIAVGDLLGRNRADWATTITFTQSYRYYRVKLSYASAKKWLVSKIWLGSAIDIGDPILDLTFNTNDSTQPAFANQNNFYSLNFVGLTASEKNTLFDRIEKDRAYSDIVGWDSGNTVFNNSEYLKVFKLQEVKYKIKVNQFYDVTLDLIEAF